MTNEPKDDTWMPLSAVKAALARLEEEHMYGLPEFLGYLDEEVTSRGRGVATQPGEQGQRRSTRPRTMVKTFQISSDPMEPVFIEVTSRGNNVLGLRFQLAGQDGQLIDFEIIDD